MAQTFKALSALLCYPGDSLKAAAGEMRAALAADGILADGARRALDGLIAELDADDLLDLQERYVLLFDRTGSLSLYLFEHVHGESRERGQAMADLLDYYARHGMQLRVRELPDYLPLYLEFLSTLPETEARGMLADPVTIIAVLGRRLLERGSPYAAVFAVLEELAQARPDQAAIEQASVGVNLSPETGEELDKAWQETEVIFGPGQTEADCNSCAPPARPAAAAAARP